MRTCTVLESQQRARSGENENISTFILRSAFNRNGRSSPKKRKKSIKENLNLAQSKGYLKVLELKRKEFCAFEREEESFKYGHGRKPGAALLQSPRRIYAADSRRKSSSLGL